MARFRLPGVVIETETGRGLPGLVVKVFEAGWGFAGLIGTASTGASGAFEIVADDMPVSVHVHVYTGDGLVELYSTSEPLTWSRGTYEIRVPRALLAASAPSGEIALIGDDDEVRTVFRPGETLMLSARGLLPSTPHRVSVGPAGDDGLALFFEDVVLTNYQGDVEPVVIWRFMGLEATSGTGRATVVEAVEYAVGKRMAVTLREREHVVATAEFELDAHAHAPVVVSCDRNGAVLASFEAGAHDARVLLMNFPPAPARVWMAHSRGAWRAGDVFAPVELANGRIAREDIEAPATEATTVVLAPAAHVPPGEYSFVVRTLSGDGSADDSLVLQPGDVVGARRGAGLIVRKRIWQTG